MSGGREEVCYLAELGGVEGNRLCWVIYVCSFRRNCYIAELAVEIDGRSNRET